MLASSKLVGFVATAHPEAARRFYVDKLGLKLIEDSPYALVVQASTTTIRIQKVEQVASLEYTALGWEVSNIDETVRRLAAEGISCELFEGMKQSPEGVWRTPNGSAVAWFRDPDRNLLSITQHVHSEA